MVKTFIVTASTIIGGFVGWYLGGFDGFQERIGAHRDGSAVATAPPMSPGLPMPPGGIIEE